MLRFHRLVKEDDLCKIDLHSETAQAFLREAMAALPEDDKSFDSIKDCIRLAYNHIVEIRRHNPSKW